ncbi:MAG: lipid-A-disaccharide synthase [Candidatus Binatia bacterium]
MSRKVLIVVGEASGDAQAAKLVAGMMEEEEGLSVYGVGGAAMRSVGVDTVFDAAGLSVMGFAELRGRLGALWRCYRWLRENLLSASPPDLLILVDFPDFNLRLARVAKKGGVPVFYYVSPQVWAWRAGRIRQIASRVDKMVVLFPFEESLYREAGLDTYFVGHPLAEEVVPTREASETRKIYGVDDDLPLVALLPGSRAREVRTLLPIMTEAASRLVGRARFLVAKAPGLDRNLIDELLRSNRLDMAVAEGDTYNVIAAAEVAVLSSGTATVECALLGCPMVVMYRMSRLSYVLARALVRIPWIAMPNIVLGRQAVPELVQSKANTEELVRELEGLLESPELRARVREELGAVGERLVRPGAARRAARIALDTMT